MLARASACPRARNYVSRKVPSNLLITTFWNHFARAIIIPFVVISFICRLTRRHLYNREISMSFDAGASIHLPTHAIGNDTDTEIEKFYFYALEKEIQ